MEAPLVSLIFGGNYFIVREILSSCTIDLNKQETRGWTPLLAASAQNRQDIVKILLEKGANPDIPNLIQVTPLMMAAHHGFFQVCSLLIEYGASINMQDEEGNTALYVASKMGHIRIVQLLLSNHAKPDIPTCSGKTPLDIAYDNSHGKKKKIIRNHINHSQ